MTNQAVSFQRVENRAHALLMGGLAALLLAMGFSSTNARAVFLTGGGQMPQAFFAGTPAPGGTSTFAEMTFDPGQAVRTASVPPLPPAGSALPSAISSAAPPTVPAGPLSTFGTDTPQAAAASGAPAGARQFSPALSPPTGGAAGAPNATGPTDPTAPTDPTNPTDPTDPVSAVPEPGTWIMLLIGFFFIGWTMRRGSASRTAQAAA